MTDTITGYSWADVKSAIEALGGSVSSRISVNTDYVVIDEDPGYKKGRVKTSAEAIRTRAKIKEFGIKTLNEAKFKRLLGKAYTRKSSVAAKDVIAALREQSPRNR